MGLLKPVGLLAFLGIFSFPQLSYSAESESPEGRDCPDELCGAGGGGKCHVASPGFICTCNEGFNAHETPLGMLCMSPQAIATLAGSGEGGAAGGGEGAGEGTGGSAVHPMGITEEGDEWSEEFESEVPLPDAGETTGACAEYPCGDPAAGRCQVVENGYVCICSPGFIPRLVNEKTTCVGAEIGVCEGDPCRGSTCIPLGDSYTCECSVGFHSYVSADTGASTCVPDSESDSCANKACGPAEAVKGCSSENSSWRQCICQPGYTSRGGPDGQVCEPETPESDLGPSAVPEGGEGGPSAVPEEEVGPFVVPGEVTPGGGDHSGVPGESVLPEAQEHPIVQPPGTVEPVPGHPSQGVLQPETGPSPGGAGGEAPGGAGGEAPGGAGGEAPGGAGGEAPGGAGGEAPGGGKTGQEEKHEGAHGGGLVIAGGVIGALILIAAAGGGAVMYKQKHGEHAEASEAIDYEQSGPSGVEVENDESEILINVSNADWAS